jgi:hypothetical protein
MLPTKNMIMIESLDDDCPPESGAADLDVNPGDRYCQLGDSATACVLDGTVRTLRFTEENAALVIDIGPKIGDWARSALRTLPTMIAPVYYCAIGPPDEVRWAQHFAKTLAQDLFLDKSLKIAGFEPLSAEPDQNQAADIQLPALQICGLKDGRAIELADYDRWERSSAVAESFETLHERWKAFQNGRRRPTVDVPVAPEKAAMRQ